MKKFWIIDGSGEEYETKELAIEAAKRQAALISKTQSLPYVFYGNHPCDESIYVYEAIAIARIPTPNIEVCFIEDKDT